MADTATGTEKGISAIPGQMTLSERELDTFLDTGDLPGDTTPTESAEKTAEAAAAKPVDQAASTDVVAKAAPEAAEPGAKSKAPGSKKSAAERAEEIERATADDEERLRKALAKRRETREALEEAEREPATSRKAEKTEDPAASTSEPAWKKYRNMPDAPKSDQFETLDDFAAAMGTFVAEKIAEQAAGAVYDSRSSQERELAQRDSQFIEVATKASERLQAELEADPGLLDRVDPRWKALNPSDRLAEGEKMTVAHFIKDQATFHSNHPGKLAAWLTENDNAELRRIGRMRPDQIIREIAIKDHSFGDPTATDDPGDAAGERQHPRKSKAPAPAPTLGSKATAGRDPRKAPDSYADFDQWNEEESKHDLATRR